MDTTLLSQVEEQDVIEVIGEDLDLPREVAEILNKKGDLTSYFAAKLNAYYDKVCSREESEWQEEVDYLYPMPALHMGHEARMINLEHGRGLGAS